MAGAGYARNVGVDHCSFSFLVFCDADDEIPNDYVSKMVEGIIKHGFIGCGIDYKKLNSSHLVDALNFGVSGLIISGYPTSLANC